jgi:ABC-2 type transport system ATP-binding protein
VKTLMPTPIIKTENLTKIYSGNIKAVDNVSFEVEEEEIYGFLGPNGAGKTTTILMLITLLKPTHGTAAVCGYDIAKEQAKVRSCIGYVSQDTAVDENLTGRENLLLQGRFYHLPKEVLEKRINEVLDMVDLADRANSLVSTYSGGMRKRLDIAEGLIHRPRVLFVDEPTLGLDIQTRHKIWEYIQGLREEAHMTIFLTTHYMDEADKLCDRISIIDYGQIKVVGEPNQLKNQIGGDIITLKFTNQKNNNANQALTEIKKLPSIENIAPTQDSYNVIAKDGETTVPKIFEAVGKAGATVESISLKRPSLDDVFMAYTGRELREEAGSKEDLVKERIRMRRARM